MSGTAAVSTQANVHGSTSIRMLAFEGPDNGYGREFVSIRVGEGPGEVSLLICSVDVLDRLLETVADARTALRRITRDADAGQPELVAS